MKSFILLLLLLKLINAIELCTYSAYNKYQNLIKQYPDHANQFNIMSKIPLSIWYTDRDSNSLSIVQDTLNNCNDFATIVVLYALPNKDCAAGFSSGGSVKTDNDYKKFVEDLNNAVNNKPIIYVIEPDAIGLSLDNDCGINNNYLPDIKIAIDILASNINANIYIEISWWKLIYDDRQIQQILDILKQIDPNKKIKGITTNVSNYRKTTEIITACEKIKDYKCMIDSSRNWNGPTSDNQWCNSISGGIGDLPDTSDPNIWKIWVKPAIDLDGPCTGFSNSFQATGKNAGDISIEYFDILWKNGNPLLQQCLS
jgi:hypothetical protein